MSEQTSARIVLASTSRYRADLLRRLRLEFTQNAPDTDESLRDGEPPAARAIRLAHAKASAVASKQTSAIVIGSDQVAELEGTILRKPGHAETARMQLAHCSGHVASFCTGVCVIDTRARTHREYAYLDTTRVHFRNLDAATIARYVDTEQPLDCAGSFKCEGLGAALFERIESTDPSALIGLPLIAVARLLRECGLMIP